MIETRFKDSEVGWIPEDWEVLELHEVISHLRTGLNPRTNFTLNTADASGYYITVRELKGFDIEIDEKTDRINDDAASQINERSKLKTNDVLFSGTGTIGQTAIVKSKPYNWGIKEGIYAITTKQNQLSPVFLIIYFQTPTAVSLIDSYASGSTVRSVPMSKLEKMPIPIPTLTEQTRIATALSNIDALISELSKLIEKKQVIKQGAMQQLLTGKKRLKGFKGEWCEIMLGEIAEILNGDRSERYPKNNEIQKRGIPFINAGHITDGKIDFTNMDYITRKKYNSMSGAKLREGDILVCLRGSLGKNAKVEFSEGTVASSLCVIRTKIDKDYLCAILNSFYFSDFIKAENNGSSQPNLSAASVLNFLFPLPPTHKEQSAIASALSSMDEEISAIEAKREKYTAIKQGMMQQLLTGKIRLIENVAKPNTTSANVYFRRSVLAAEIADRLCDEPTFGHVKMEKMLFLTERLCHIDIGSHYHRDAAGPYDNNALRSIDSQLKKQKWFEVKRTEKGNRYVPMQNRGKHKTYFNRYYSDVFTTFDKIINTFKSQRTEQCEIVATLYSAWEDLLHSNQPFNDADIVNEVLNNWHESKKRISQDRWLSAIQWMRENGFTPDVRNE